MGISAIDEKFEDALKVFEKQVGEATQFWFASAALNEVSRRRRVVLNTLSENPTFWNTVRGGLQSHALVALGRVFGSGRHNIDTLMSMAREQRTLLFSSSALEERKKRLTAGSPAWLPAFMKSAHVPTAQEIERLDRLVEQHRAKYSSQYQIIRDKEIAHTVISDRTYLEGLYAKTRIRDLERLIVFLNQLYDALWNMYFNGRRPRLRPARFSVKSLVRRPIGQLRSGATQERIVAETRRSLQMLVRGHQAQRSHEARLRNVRLLRYR